MLKSQLAPKFHTHPPPPSSSSSSPSASSSFEDRFLLIDSSIDTSIDT